MVYKKGLVIFIVYKLEEHFFQMSSFCSVVTEFNRKAGMVSVHLFSVSIEGSMFDFLYKVIGVIQALKLKK